ncbi:MAG: hypothetical protein WAN65_31905 [Candidatus Sulfotelmatobacter sp.]
MALGSNSTTFAWKTSPNRKLKKSAATDRTIAEVLQVTPHQRSSRRSDDH